MDRSQLDAAVVLGNMVDSYLLVDKSLNVITFNESLRSFFYQRFNSEIEVGRNLIQCFPEELRQRETLRYRRILSGQTEQHEVGFPGAKYYLVSIKPALDSKGEIVGAVAYTADISERKQFEQSLRLSEQRFRSLVQEGSDLITILDEEGVYSYVSPTSVAMVGTEPAVLVGTSIFSYIHPDDVGLVLEAFEDLKSEKRVALAPYRFRRKDGSWAWQRSVCTNLKGDPVIAGFVFNTVDITELLEAQNEVAGSHERFQKLVQASSESILDLDLKTNKLNISEGFTRNFGHQLRSPADNRTFLQSLVHPDDRDRMIESFKEAIADEAVEVRDYSYRLRKADGEYARVEDHLIILRDERGVARRTLGTLKDITREYTYQRLDDIELEVMTLSMRHDTTLRPVLTFYLQRLEELFPEFRGSIMEIKDNCLNELCSPSLPRQLISQISGLPIGPNVGSCGTAAYRRQRVVVENVFEDEGWRAYADLARDYGIAACWSEPIFDAKGNCIATFAGYYATHRVPSPTERLAIARTTRLISIILTRFESLNELRKINERNYYVNRATNEAVYDWDIQNDRLYWDMGFERLFGHAIKRDIPFPLASWRKLVHPEDRMVVENSLTDFLSDSSADSWESEYRLQCLDGSYSYVAEVGYLIRDSDSKPERMIGALRDISERKLNEIALLGLNAQLSRYATQMESANKELEQFAYIASHDLQEPLRMVSSFVGLLKSRYSDQLDETALEYIGFAVDGAGRMRKIILDLLDYSRVGRYGEATEFIAIDELVQDVCAFYQDKINAKGAEVKCITAMPTLECHRSPVQQVFQNLIGNALKYSRAEAPPKVSISAVEGSEEWQFAVQDNGLGIEPRYFDKVFVLFQRLHSVESHEGTGIGLAVVKKIVEQLGGKVWLESEPGKGSTFYFTLPKVFSSKAGDE